MIISNKTILSFAACVIVAAVIWASGGSYPAAPEGWQIFSVFIAVIVSFILRPFPMGVMVLIGIVVLVTFRSISIEEALSGYGDTTVWLVVAAFLIAGGVGGTGFGKRVALWLVLLLGKSITGLGYAISSAELVLGPVVPSNTARGGGIMAPIVDSLARALGASPSHDPQRAGAYLSLTGSHANLVTASMFLTGMAANPLVAKALQDIYHIRFSWADWALGAIVPGLLNLAILPLLTGRLIRPSVTGIQQARASAKQQLAEMGTVKRSEKLMAAVLISLLALWITEPIHHLGTTLVAWMGVLALLLGRVQSWDDMVRNEKAWDTLIWLGGLLAMANMLNKYGFIGWFADSAGGWVEGMDGNTAIILLGLIYFYSMYGFSMFTAHISAFAAPFLAVSFATGGDPMLAAAVFAYFSCLCGCTTNYSSGPVIIYFGLGYVSIPKWFATGVIISVFHLVIWLGAGMVWWRFLGWV